MAVSIVVSTSEAAGGGALVPQAERSKERIRTGTRKRE
jgi:hypothetical protein